MRSDTKSFSASSFGSGSTMRRASCFPTRRTLSKGAAVRKVGGPFHTFYVGLTQTAKPVPARARLTYLPETLQAVAGAQSVSIRSDAESLPARVKRYFGALDTLDADRSEERRVGKECRH